MIAQVTQGVKVSVETEYQPSYSSPSQYHYVFTYRITIENQSDFTIQLMRRQWFIHDAGFQGVHEAYSSTSFWTAPIVVSCPLIGAVDEYCRTVVGALTY